MYRDITIASKTRKKTNMTLPFCVLPAALLLLLFVKSPLDDPAVIVIPPRIDAGAGNRNFDEAESLEHVGYVSKSDKVSCVDGGIRVFKPLEQCQVVVDLKCPHKYRDAFFHRLVDCLAYEFGGIQHALSTYEKPCFLGYYTRAKLYRDLVAGNMNLVCSHESIDKHQIPVNSTYEQDTTLLPVFKPNRTDVSYSVRLLFNHFYGMADSIKSTTILLVKRFRPRNFSEESFTMLHSSLQKLARDFGRQIDVYNGTETIRDTVQKFRRADIVLHFHGAAAANMLFARRGTRIIEINTFVKSDDSKQWRTNMNRLKELRPDVSTLIYSIPLSHGWPELNLDKVDKHADADRYIRDFKDVSLRKSDVVNLVEIGRNMLQNIGP